MKSEYIKKLTDAVIIILVAAIIGGAAFSIGYDAGAQKPETIIVKGVTNIGDENVTADFDVFWQAWKFVKNEHIDGENVEDVSLVHGSIAGMVNALGDPNTNFLPPDDAKKFEEDVRGSFGGIGAEIGKKDGQLIIVAPLKNSPAEKSGLQSGDNIIAVDGQSTGGLDVLEAVKIIRGEAGSVVTLTIFRESWGAPREVEVLREIIQIPTLEHTIIDDEILHIQLFSFNENAPFEFYQSVLSASFSGARGVILDLRNNPGGFLEVAVNIAGWFLDRGSVVVSEEFRSGEQKVFRASGNEALKEIPTVVLQNGGSASASEILAGALRDNRGIKIVGEKSFGKGSVQELKELKDDSSLKLTVAKWLLPSGAVIEKNGLEPDVEISLTEEDVEAERDVQLEKAIEILRLEI